MSLRQQYDDLMNTILDIASVGGGEEEFIETVAEVMNIGDENKRIEAENKSLKKIIAKEKKKLAKNRAEFKRLSAELAREKKKIESEQKGKRAAEKVLEELRRAINRKGANASNAEILSLMESISVSDDESAITTAEIE